MHKTVQNLSNIKNQIKSKINELKYNNYDPKIIAVSKTFPISHIMPLIESGHTHFGENKVQEALEKWSEIKEKNKNLKLHMVGKLQTNKVKFALKIFDFIHSLDNLKLAKKISEEQKNFLNKPKIFIQINIGNEPQKSGIHYSEVKEFVNTCKEKYSLNIVGLMCIPPNNINPKDFYLKMQNLRSELNLEELSMGMSSDYLDAINYGSTFLRIGTNIFGERK